MTDLKKEIWFSMQKTLFVENTAVFLADTTAKDILSTTGNKVHKPIFSKARSGTYTPYSDITNTQHSATKETLTVDTFEYGASEIDDTDSKQSSSYYPVEQAGTDLGKTMGNRIEQLFLTKITDSSMTLDGQVAGGASGSLLDFRGAPIWDTFEAADSMLGSNDVPFENRVAVLGPHAVSAIRKIQSQRESRLGDTVFPNGVISNWNGWMIVQNNNLPWSGTLTIATQPTDGDTVVIAGVTFTFKTTLGSTAGQVLIGGSASAARTNLKSAIEKGGTAGTDYVDLSIVNRYKITEQRHVRVTISSNDMNMTGFGDIVVSETLTASADVWSARRQDAYFGVRGAIDLVVQDMPTIETLRKEKGFANITKALLGLGVKMFDDGARASIRMKSDASVWL